MGHLLPGLCTRIKRLGTDPFVFQGAPQGTLGSGWANIGNYSDAVLNANSAINAGNVYLSYWLIGAYNATANPTGGSVTGTGFDYVKLSSVSGDVSVPEPGTLVLSGLAVLGSLFLRGRRMVRENRMNPGWWFTRCGGFPSTV